MKLTELNPKLSDTNWLVFDCPKCKGDSQHKIRIPLAPTKDKHNQSWQSSGQFPDTLTLIPSVNAHCWHGFIQNGNIINV